MTWRCFLSQQLSLWVVVLISKAKTEAIAAAVPLIASDWWMESTFLSFLLLPPPHLGDLNPSASRCLIEKKDICVLHHHHRDFSWVESKIITADCRWGAKSLFPVSILGVELHHAKPFKFSNSSDVHLPRSRRFSSLAVEYKLPGNWVLPEPTTLCGD